MRDWIERHAAGSPRIWAGILATFWAALTLRPFTESDVFWHLMLGRSVLEHGSRTVPEPSAWPSFSDRVVAQEWLWDVATYWLWQHAGWVGLGWLLVIIAAASALACYWLVRTWSPQLGLSGQILALAVASPLVLTRIRERPEALAMVLLPLVLGLAHLVATTDHRKRCYVWSATLVLLSGLWVQVHASAVLVPAIVGLVFARAWWVPGERRRRSLLLTVWGGATLLLTTGAHGVGLLGNVWAHAGGYAVAHITDMAPPTWEMFNPEFAIHLPLYVVFAAVCIGLGLRRRPIPWVELGLALLGAAIVATARRGTGPAGVLLLPLAGVALQSALQSALPRQRQWATAAAVVIAGYVGYRTVDFYTGPDRVVGSMGLVRGSYPLAAAKLLERAPAGAKVLSTYQAGAPLAFLLRGHVRTFVDSRTPLFFSDSEYALARTLWGAEHTLARAHARYGFDFVVTERSVPLCARLAEDEAWAAVLVEPGFTTFQLRRDGMLSPPLERLAPCGVRLVSRQACGEDGGAALAREIDAVSAHQSAPYPNLLRAERLIRCDAENANEQRILDLVPEPRAALGFTRARDRILGWLWAWHGQTARAIDLLKPYAERGDADMVLPILPVLQRPEHRTGLRDLLDAVVDHDHDAAPGWVHAELANSCATEADTDCAALHALRAAALGELEVGAALCWLSREGADAKMRAHAAKWLQLLRHEARARGTVPAALASDACEP